MVLLQSEDVCCIWGLTDKIGNWLLCIIICSQENSLYVLHKLICWQAVPKYMYKKTEEIYISVKDYYCPFAKFAKFVPYLSLA